MIICISDPHGNERGIAKTSTGDEPIRWADLALDICTSPGLTEESVVYLGCCKGGLKRGALIMMAHCNTIHHVCGSECNVNEQDVNLAFATFASHHGKGTESKRIESIVSMTIDKGFSIFSRYNMDVEIAAVRDRIWNPEHPMGSLPCDFYVFEEEDENLIEAAKVISIKEHAPSSND